MERQDDSFFLYFDGDDVGAQIELLLLDEKVDDAAELSRRVVIAVGNIAERLQLDFGARLIFAAGDEILAVTNLEPTENAIQSLRSEFRRSTGLTISCGLGSSAMEAARSLHLAKLRGKDRIVGVVTR